MKGSPTKIKGKRKAPKPQGTAAKRTKAAGGSNARGPGGSNSRGQFYEDHASAIGKGYENLPNNSVRLCVHVDADSGKVLARTLVCAISEIDLLNF